MVEVIQQIGSYAGFAAIVGLAVLSALYFSQARDLRKLREWAGRAPDRPAPPRAAGTTPDPSAALERPPAVLPEREAKPPSQREAEPVPHREAQPAAAMAAPATAAASGATVTGAGAGTATALSGAPPERGATGPAGPPAPGSVPGAAPRVSRPAPPRAVPNGLSSAPGRPASPRSAASPPARGPERSISLRYVVLAVVGALIVTGAGTFAVGLLGGREDATPAQGTGTPAPPPEQGPPGTPASITFSVLNGTGVDGLAKQVADELEAAGYRRGNVTNAPQQKAESVVLYAQAARADALAVAKEIDVSQTEPIDAPSQTLAGDASVVVVVGADQTQ